MSGPRVEYLSASPTLGGTIAKVTDGTSTLLMRLPPGATPEDALKRFEREVGELLGSPTQRTSTLLLDLVGAEPETLEDALRLLLGDILPLDARTQVVLAHQLATSMETVAGRLRQLCAPVLDQKAEQ